MISHKYKCIFIHIQRTGGSSIEQALVGQDWWKVKKETKHLLASQAKQIYSKYWTNYFKFSFVRHPYSRTISMAQYGKFFFGEQINKEIEDKHIAHYRKTFGESILIEHDRRFYSRLDLQNYSHQQNCVYQNIIDEELDYVGSFENLETGFKEICNTLGLQNVELPKVNKSSVKIILSENARLIIDRIYEKDFLKYNYKKILI